MNILDQHKSKSLDSNPHKVWTQQAFNQIIWLARGIIKCSIKALATECSNL